MKIGCIDCTFNYLPFPSELARPARVGLGFLGRVGLIKRYHYLNHAMKQIASLGFESVQITCLNNELNPSKIKKTCKQLGLSVSSIGFRSIGFNRIIDFARRLDVPIVCLHSSLEINLSELADKAKSSGIRLALENSPYGLVRTDNELLNMVRGVKNLYVNLDIGNLNPITHNPARVVNKLKKYIIHVHIKDSRFTRNGFVFTEFGKGNVNIHAFLLALKRIRYKGPMILEYEGNNPLHAIKNGREFVEAELSRIGYR